MDNELERLKQQYHELQMHHMQLMGMYLNEQALPQTDQELALQFTATEVDTKLAKELLEEIATLDLDPCDRSFTEDDADKWFKLVKRVHAFLQHSKEYINET